MPGLASGLLGQLGVQIDQAELAGQLDAVLGAGFLLVGDQPSRDIAGGDVHVLGQFRSALLRRLAPKSESHRPAAKRADGQSGSRAH